MTLPSCLFRITLLISIATATHAMKAPVSPPAATLSTSMRTLPSLPSATQPAPASRSDVDSRAQVLNSLAQSDTFIPAEIACMLRHPSHPGWEPSW